MLFLPSIINTTFESQHCFIFEIVSVVMQMVNRLKKNSIQINTVQRSLRNTLNLKRYDYTVFRKSEMHLNTKMSKHKTELHNVNVSIISLRFL